MNIECALKLEIMSVVWQLRVTFDGSAWSQLSSPERWCFTTQLVTN